VALARDYSAELLVQIPARGRTWVVIAAGETREREGQ
jgi:hypothetical protein